MTKILEDAKVKMDAMRETLAVELAEKPLSRMLRRDTWPDHKRAQFSPFELALAGGTIPRDAYVHLLTQVLQVYRALEERMEMLKDDPIAGLVNFPELNRSQAVEADLLFLAGEGWEKNVEMLDITREFVQRILTCEPVQFVAHHYNRYLADLSGGIIIGNAIKRAWNLDEDGVRYSQFDKIDDANAFKDVYRGRLDSLPIDIAGKLNLIQEVIASYEYNIQMTALLAERYLEPAGA